MCLLFIHVSVVGLLCFPKLLDSVFLLGCNSITSFVLWQFAPSFQCFQEMYRQGVLGQMKFTCSNSNQIPGEWAGCCVRSGLFQRNILCCHEAFKTESILCVFGTAVACRLQMLETSVLMNISPLCMLLFQKGFSVNTVQRWLEGVAHTFHRIVGKVCELWQQCECHSGVTVSQESHSSEGFNIAEVILTPEERPVINTGASSSNDTYCTAPQPTGPSSCVYFRIYSSC